MGKSVSEAKMAKIISAMRSDWNVPHPGFPIVIEVVERKSAKLKKIKGMSDVYAKEEERQREFARKHFERIELYREKYKEALKEMQLSPRQGGKSQLSLLKQAIWGNEDEDKV